MNTYSPLYHWEYYAPPILTQSPLPDQPGWLSKVRKLRGRVLYANGHRPHFQLSNNQFGDADPLDFACYHVLVWVGNEVVGCCRLLPLAATQVGLVESAIGAARLNQLLDQFATSLQECCETSRWMVDASFSGQHLGQRLAAGTWALGRWLDFSSIIGFAGTRDGQTKRLEQMGIEPVPGMALFPSEIFNDELCLVYGRLDQPDLKFSRLIEEMTLVLRLPLTEASLNQG